MTRPWTLVLGLLLLGCVAEERPPWLYDIGDPCRTAYRFCVDDSSVQRCVDDVWVLARCDQACSELGPAYLARGCAEDCLCELADPDGCTPREASCAGSDTVDVCSDSQTWDRFECGDVCAVVALESLGCITDDEAASCWCTAEGTPCEANSPPVCVDSMSVARCEGGSWVFAACATTCGAPAQCVAWATPPACECS